MEGGEGGEGSGAAARAAGTGSGGWRLAAPRPDPCRSATAGAARGWGTRRGGVPAPCPLSVSPPGPRGGSGRPAGLLALLLGTGSEVRMSSGLPRWPRSGCVPRTRAPSWVLLGCCCHLAQLHGGVPDRCGVCQASSCKVLSGSAWESSSECDLTGFWSRTQQSCLTRARSLCFSFQLDVGNTHEGKLHSVFCNGAVQFWYSFWIWLGCFIPAMQDKEIREPALSNPRKRI